MAVRQPFSRLRNCFDSEGDGNEACGTGEETIDIFWIMLEILRD